MSNEIFAGHTFSVKMIGAPFYQEANIQITPEIVLKRATTTEESMLVNAVRSKNRIKSLIGVVQALMISGSFVVDELTKSDEVNLLIALRRAIEGDLYSFKVPACPDCSHSGKLIVDMSMFPIIEMNTSYSLVTLEDGVEVKLRPMQEKHDAIIDSFIATIEKLNDPVLLIPGIDVRWILETAIRIDSISTINNPTIRDKFEFYRNLPRQMAFAIRESISAYEGSLDINISHECDRCHAGYNFDLPLGDGFFRI